MHEDVGLTGLRYLWSQWPDAVPLQIIDIGANPIEGDAPYKALLDHGFCQVTGFEPQAEALAALNARKSPGETYHPNALGDGGDATLQLFAHSGFTSLFPINPDVSRMIGFHRATRSVGTHPIATARLDDLTDVPQADYLKIDVQGSEFNIISNGSAKLSQAVLIQTEIRFLPLYGGEPGFGALDAELRDQGFQFHDFAFLKRVALRSASHSRLRPRANRQVVDGDAFYVRDLTRPEALTPAQLFRLALLAEAVVGSPNLALFCLDNLVARGHLPQSAIEGYYTLLPQGLKREVVDAVDAR